MKNYRFNTEPVILPNAQRQMRYYSAPIEYLDSDKIWQKIEMDLKSSLNDFILTKSAFNVSIPKKANGVIIFHNAGSEFRLKPVCNSVSGILFGPNRVVYVDAFGPDIDMDIVTTRKSLHKIIIIENTAKRTLTFDFEIETTGLPEIKPTTVFGSTVFPDKQFVMVNTPDVKTILKEVQAWDAKGNLVAVDSSIVRENGKLLLRKTVKIPGNPQFPISTDATISYTAESADNDLYKISVPGSWAGAHDAVTGSLLTAQSEMRCSCVNIADFSFGVYRVGIPIFTNVGGNTITGAALTVSAKKDAGGNALDVALVKFAPHVGDWTGFNVADYREADWGSTLLASLVNISDAGYADNVFTLNAAGLVEVNANNQSVTIFGLRNNDNDIGDVDPGANTTNGCMIKTSESASDPSILLTYGVGKELTRGRYDAHSLDSNPLNRGRNSI